jgi:type VI secretion system protein ImpL
LRRWDGRQPVAYAAYDVRNVAELVQFLELQRDRLRFLAKQYAEPLVTFLANDVVQRDQPPVRLLLKWQGIQTELESYDSKKPGNSLATLEKFILSDLSEINLENCLQKLTANEQGVPGRDYFSHIRDQLQLALYQQCRVVAVQEVRRSYTEIGALFNRQLAGRFPFSDQTAGDSGSEVQPDAMQAFYRMFDKQLGISQEVLKRTSSSGPSVAEALEFLNQTAAVRAFFAAFLDGAPKQRLPAIDIQVDFRANQAQEIGGNRVIDWTLEVGEQRLRYRDVERQGRWRYGDPVRLTLRWAKDSPVIPVVDGPQPKVRVTDDTVVYEYSNRWSLISFLREHALAGMDFDRASDSRSHTLRFDIRTKLRETGQPADAPLAGELLTKVFIRVTLTSADQQDPLALPTFPRTAPPLAQDTTR